MYVNKFGRSTFVVVPIPIRWFRIDNFSDRLNFEVTKPILFSENFKFYGGEGNKYKTRRYVCMTFID